MARLVRVALLVAVAACRIPEDPEGTTDAVAGATLRVGVLGTPLAARDQDAVARVAAALDADLEYVTGDPHSLLAGLESGDVHLLAGGIPADTPFQPLVALSHPIGKVSSGGNAQDRVLALRKGENRFLVAVNRAVAELLP